MYLISLQTAKKNDNTADNTFDNTPLIDYGDGRYF